MSNENIITLRKEQQARIEMQELRRDELIGSLGVWGPVAIPLIPAALTAIAITTHYPDLLAINFWVALALGVIAAGGIEVLGIVSTETFLQMRSYNQMRSESDEPAPQQAAGIVAGCYMLVVFALVVLLKVWPDLAIYSLIPLTALGALVSWVVVLRRQHGKRELAQMQTRMENDQLGQLMDQIGMQNGQIESLRSVNENLQTANADLHAGSEKLQRELYSLRQQSVNQPVKPTSDEGVKTAGNEQGAPVVDPDNPEATVKAFAVWQIATDGKVNQSEIARLTSISRPTVAKYVNGLAKVGV